MRLRKQPPIASAALVACLLAAAASSARAQGFLSPVVVGTVESGSINEASGIAASFSNPGVLWVHNDSGDSARAFAMNTAGDHLGIYNIAGVGATDWEDIAVGPGPAAGDSYLYFGDIGDNDAVRSSIQVHRVLEPTVISDQSPVTTSLAGAETITLLYPDGARDAETLLVDPANGDIYIISKRDFTPRVYRAAYPQSTASPITMDYLGPLPWSFGFPVGGAISPDGDEIVVRGGEVLSNGASLWNRSPGQSVFDALSGSRVTVPSPSEPQGEAITFDRRGDGYYTVSEGVNQPIYYIARDFVGDFDDDGDVDADDVDILCSGDPAADLNGDGDVDEDDLVILVADHLHWDNGVDFGTGTFRGDFNLDGAVNGTDLSIMSANFGTTVGFAGGNANCDATVNGTDLSILASTFGSVATTSVPEPTTMTLLGLSAHVVLLRRKA